MKRILIPAFALLVLAGCRKDDNPATLSVQDKAAIEEMDAYLKKAKSYNDSLQLCCDSTIVCNDSLHQHYDDMLHYCDSMFQQYHIGFNHSGGHDDHSHNNSNSHTGNMHSSGGMTSHNSNDQHSNDQCHQMTEHNEMTSMMNSHCYNH